MKYSFNHRTNELVHMLIISVLSILLHIYVCLYADIDCVNCKASLDILITKRAVHLLFFLCLFLELSRCIRLFRLL